MERRGGACEDGPAGAEEGRPQRPRSSPALKGPGCHPVPVGSWALRLWRNTGRLAPPRASYLIGCFSLLTKPSSGHVTFPSYRQKEKYMTCLDIPLDSSQSKEIPYGKGLVTGTQQTLGAAEPWPSHTTATETQALHTTHRPSRWPSRWN